MYVCAHARARSRKVEYWKVVTNGYSEQVSHAAVAGNERENSFARKAKRLNDLDLICSRILGAVKFDLSSSYRTKLGRGFCGKPRITRGRRTYWDWTKLNCVGWSARSLVVRYYWHICIAWILGMDIEEKIVDSAPDMDVCFFCVFPKIKSSIWILADKSEQAFVVTH